MTWIRCVLVILLPAVSLAQEGTPSAGVVGQANTSAQRGGMEQMKMDDHGTMNMQPKTFIESIVHHGGAGTSTEPNSTPVPMLMTSRGAWSLMLHANVFVLDEQQTGSRGADKVFSTNWFMGMAQRKAGPGTFTGRAMLSIEPATVR